MVTIGKSRKFSGKSKKALARPFDPRLLAKARQIVAHYQVVLWFEDGQWYGRGLEIPNTMDDGKTPDECVAHVRKALVGTVAWMLEEKMPVPPAASENIRTEQVNLRLTAEEKLSLEVAAKRAGADGVSDFVRTASLAAASAG